MLYAPFLRPTCSIERCSGALRDNVPLGRLLNPTETMWTHVNPSQPKWTHVSPKEPKSTQVKPSEPKWTQLHPSQPKTTQINRSQPKSTQVNPGEPKSTHVNPNEREWTQTNPSQPKTEEKQMLNGMSKDRKFNCVLNLTQGPSGWILGYLLQESVDYLFRFATRL